LPFRKFTTKSGAMRWIHFVGPENNYYTVLYCKSIERGQSCGGDRAFGQSYFITRSVWQFDCCEGGTLL